MAFPNHLEGVVDIIFSGEEDPAVSFEKLGFSNRRATKSIKPYECINLLKQYAKDNNKYSLPLGTDSERGTLNAQVNSLRTVLKKCFGY